MSNFLYHIHELSDQKVTRSIFDETKFYDQIAWFKDSNGTPRLDLKFKNGGSYNFTSQVLKNRNISKTQVSWMISDHFPLWAEFEY